MLYSPRMLAGLWAGKTAIWLNRRIGHGGTSFPGGLGRRIAPGLLSALAAQLKQGAMVITGTNGKTTTSKMLAEMIAASKLTLTHNRAGANLVGGITAAFIESASIGGSIGSDLGVIEVDEATIPQLVREVRPRGVVVTNFFRDQLDRFGELDKTVTLVEEALALLPPQSVAILNADDPLVASIGRRYRGRVLYFGIDDRSYGSREMTQSAETRFCRLCGHPLAYDWFFFGQLGHYRCVHCGFERPQPKIRVSAIELKGEEGSAFTVNAPQGNWRVELSTPGFYNIYNALAATAAALRLDLPEPSIRAGLQGYRTNFGRMERLELDDGRRAFLALIKNPTGCDEVLRTLTQNRGPKRLLVIINDNAADGRDISWLWDADFEALAPVLPELRSISTSGLRGEDMALRLHYAGVPADAISYEPDISHAIAAALEMTSPEETLYILPTYTALLESKTALANLGHSPRYWEE
ncbi:DUF1727 domain-containing protein [Heliobacterium undosum]|uniref:Lipid II isoglutaminyl synthase (glutamine-hydrolyzing) subunit MurT n=1 Tax=Heliomicrobium undosum TaxID=121734 RepID=A0A845L2J4_9FIRM|nr:Mur ligase family protein [Heliomicrobium undosum]MZP29309.1 DUF1727 domain-containing protein [Heliomicrobium undosum]